jgi:hypothetical protein
MTTENMSYSVDLTPIPQGARNRHSGLIEATLFRAIANRLREDLAQRGVNISEAEACRRFAATLDFLQLCGEYSDLRFTPATPVDDGWHIFVLYTREYAQFCNQLCGRFIHHTPCNTPGQEGTMPGWRATVAFMRQHGISFEEDIWRVAGVTDDDGDGEGESTSEGCYCGS